MYYEQNLSFHGIERERNKVEISPTNSRRKLDDAQGDIITQEDLILMVNTTITPELKLEGYARELVRSLQEARKTAGYEVTDRIKLSIAGFEADQIISKFGDYISTETLASIVTNNETSDVQGECDVDDGIINFTIRKE